MAESTIVRSRESLEEIELTFYNISERNVEVIWIDFNGHFNTYFELQPRRGRIVQSFKTHPWIFRDVNTKEHLYVRHRKVFEWPSSNDTNNTIETDNTFETNNAKIRLFIHYPVRTLTELGLLAVKRHLQSQNAIRTLEIPRTLADKLETLYDNIEILYENDSR